MQISMPVKINKNFPGNEVKKDKEFPVREPDPEAKPITPVRNRPCQLLKEKRLENKKPTETDGFETGDATLPKFIEVSN